MKLDELTEQQLNEVFDSAGKYPISNLTPKAKVPHMMAIAAEGKENLVVRFCNYAAKGDAVKQVKPGDKFMQVQIMQMSDKGNLQVLKGGLGNDPIAAMNAICDVTLDAMRVIHTDACLIRFPIKQLQGKAHTLSRIAARIVDRRGKGTYQYVPGMAKFENKYMYILIARKSKQLADIKGLGIDPEMYDIVPAAVGDVVICKKTGDKVTKVEAVEGSLAAKENKRSEASAIKGVTLSRKQFLQSTRELQGNSFKIGGVIYGNEFTNPDDITGVEGKTNGFTEAIGDTINKPTAGGDLFGSVQVPENLIKKYQVVNAKNMAQFAGEMREVLSAKYDTFKVKTQTREEFIDGNMREIMSNVFRAQRDKAQAISALGNAYNKDADFSLDEKKAIKAYTDVYYEDINEIFVANEKPSERVSKWINDLDSSFAKGMKIPEGMSLYRGMRVPSKLAAVSLENKMFYFSNYVSCSFIPNIFGSGIGGNAVVAGAIGNSRDINVENTKKTFFGFAVHSVKVPGIMVADLSSHPSENEVILPRGTVFKFTSVGKTERISDDPMFASQDVSAVFAECEAISGAQINESEVVYDGDHFADTGELKPATGFARFLSDELASERSNASRNRQLGRDTLASILSTNDMPPKFYN